MAEEPQPTVPKTLVPGSSGISANGRDGREGRHRQKFGLVKHGARQGMEEYINRLIEMTRHHTLLPAEFLDKKLRCAAPLHHTSHVMKKKKKMLVMMMMMITSCHLHVLFGRRLTLKRAGWRAQG